MSSAKGDQLSAEPAVVSVASFMYGAKNPPKEPTERFDGKTVIVTGANTGLGFEAAIKFAKLGASKLILGVRTTSKGEAAKAKIEEAVKAAGVELTTKVSVHKLDALDYAATRYFVQEVSQAYPEINVAVLNAGVGAITYAESPQGYERTIQVNSISTTYLALLLVPKLRQSAIISGSPSVLEFVASEGHSMVAPKAIEHDKNFLKNVSEKKNFSATGTYGMSKLLCMWSMKQVAARVSAEHVTVLAVCPGLCKSDMARDANAVIKAIDGLWKRLAARSAEEGSRSYVSGVVQGTKSHGGFWKRDRLSV